VIFGALQVTKVLSTEEVKRAIEGPGKDFGKSRRKHVRTQPVDNCWNSIDTSLLQACYNLCVFTRVP
jgi:hypothetical protein